MRWNPQRYLEFGAERGRPFADLLQRIEPQHGDDALASVVDLGCGPGNLTRVLAARWPAAHVLGIDSSPEMVARATSDGELENLRFEVDDLREWTPASPVDVLTCNATLQWVPGHLDLLPRLLSGVRPGGWFAFQVPGNFGEPSHTAIAELRGQLPWADRLGGADIALPESEEPATYLDALAGLCCRVDVWETTYFHVLQGPDAVVRWMTGTGLRPVLAALAAEHRDDFLTAYRRLIAAAYPEHEWGTVLPYRRIFVVAQR